MSSYHATVSWKIKDNEAFTSRRYSRDHSWTFDGGLTVPASASPHIVPPPQSSPQHIDPEEAFIASLSSCHMLWFLHNVASKGFNVSSYTDHATGTLGKTADNRMAMTTVTLQPQVVFEGAAPDAATLSALHAQAHKQCYIANSVTTQISIEPQ
jgi:organic hydroperoxide reductase OsmC/OhrA